MEPAKVIHCENQLGECPVWDQRTDCLLWTDILCSSLFQWHMASDTLRRFPTPYRLCSFGLSQNPNVLIAAFAQGFAWYNYQSQALRWISLPDGVAPDSGRRLNDGRVSPDGDFWCGAMVEQSPPADRASASLYQLGADERVTPLRDGLDISNGICFSPDEKTAYYADSSEGVIYQQHAPGDPVNAASPRLFYRAKTGASPDGAVCDRNGSYWSAMWGASEVVTIDALGRVQQRLPMPVSQPSCVAFGGPTFSTLFVSSARTGLTETQLAKEPLAGNLFVYEIDGKGLPEPVFGRSEPAI